jgi:ribosome-associated toxin RatA of RatAB toxin-antitoxin module
MISHSTIIHVSIENVWKHFLIKIAHPENFVPGVSNIEILGEKPNEVLRAMDIQTPNASKIRLTEKITWSPYWVKFEIIDHPFLTGYVNNLAEKISENETKITFTLNWKNKITGEDFTQQEIITNAVNKTATYIVEKEG